MDNIGFSFWSVIAKYMTWSEVYLVRYCAPSGPEGFGSRIKSAHFAVRDFHFAPLSFSRRATVDL